MFRFLLRSGVALALISCVVSTSRAEPVGRAPTAAEIASLKEPIDLGNRIYSALSRYFERPTTRTYAGVGVLTAWPTVDVLHALGYISDADLRLARQYRVNLPVVAFKQTDPVLWMQTDSGEVSFDGDGNITLRR